ncbi:MAG: hypothetical protein CR966_00630 [Pseudomonadales bacterium]|nr:MAG: hypothetical protein CR966_00630 [Pseudomonadales bacterium]
MKAVINTYMGKDWQDNPVQQTGSTTVFAVTGQPTDTSKISFKELKAQNKGDLTYEGRALYAVRHIESQNYKRTSSWGVKPEVWEARPLEKYDLMKSQNSWAKPTFKVNLETAKISGEMKFGSTDALEIKLAETKIEEKNNQLQFAGDLTAKQPVSDSEWTSSYIKDGEQDGKYQGVFMGPNAEELAGKFNIPQGEFKRSIKNENNLDKYEKYGDINGVFNAKKTKGAGVVKPAKTYEDKKLIK